jgi:fumarate reductase subunit C
MSAKAQTYLWGAQRASAAVLGICVLVHLATMIYAVRGGLTAAEILGRTKGSLAWLAFYTLFVLAVAVHVPIGLRAVLGEWLKWKGASRDWMLLAFALFLLGCGMRAVLGVFL